jgi:hypothetical protein
MFNDHGMAFTAVMSARAVPTGIMEGCGATVTRLWETGSVPFKILWNIPGQPAASIPPASPGKASRSRCKSSADSTRSERSSSWPRSWKPSAGGANVDQ